MTSLSDPTWDDRKGIRLRRYESYKAYVEHQASKLRTLSLEKYSEEFREALLERLRILSRIGHPLGASVLCLGARNGAECEAFIELGYFAVGIDLNPGLNNRHVMTGDFHAIQFADASVDIVFTNALDHAFELELILGEVRRVLKPTGCFIAEIVRGSKDDGGREPGAFESAWWDHVDTVADQIAAQGFSLLKRSRFTVPWVGDQFIFSADRTPLNSVGDGAPR